MKLDINKAFSPSTGVDLVFNINSTSPYSRSSIIHDVDPKHESIIIAQPNIPLSKNTAFKELHLTTIIHDKNRKMRVGVKCHGFKLLTGYTLANKQTAPAIFLQYELPIKETNIRAAFRLPLNEKYKIKGKIFYKNLEYFSPADFSIRDISLTGFGLVIPKTGNRNADELTRIKIHDELIIGIVLSRTDQANPIATFPIRVKVVRVNTHYSETHSQLGLKIVRIENKYDSIINKFIHDAQIDDLKKMSRRE